MTKMENRKEIKYSFFTYFFWWCSGAVIPILEKHPTEKNKFFGMGAAIFGTWMLATFSGIFAFNTIFKSLFIAIPVGIIYGLIIFNLDRFITSSMKKVGNEDEVFLTFEKIQNFFYYEFVPAFPRLVIALLIGLAISKPLELKLFDIEIEKQLDEDYENTVRDFENLIINNSKERERELKNDLMILEKAIKEKQIYIDNKIDTLNLEILGERGRKLKGYGIRAERLDELITEAKVEKQEIKSEINAIKEELNTMNSTLKTKLENYKEEQRDRVGFFDRIEALSNLIKDPENKSIWWSNFLIICLIVLIETAPILVKLISARGPYDSELEWINKKVMIQKDREIRDIKFKRNKQ